MLWVLIKVPLFLEIVRKGCFFKPKIFDSFVISPQKCILWVLIRSISLQITYCGYSSVLQLGFEGRGALGRAFFVWSYKNEGTMIVSCDVLSIKHNPIPQ